MEVTGAPRPTGDRRIHRSPLPSCPYRPFAALARRTLTYLLRTRKELVGIPPPKLSCLIGAFAVRPAARLAPGSASPSRRAEPAGEPAGLLRMGLLPSAPVTAVLLLSPSVAIFAASMSPEQQQQARVLDDQSSMRPPPAYPRPWDVLMIVVDDLRSQLSCSGPKGVDYAKVHTPHLCGLAEESLTLLRSQVATTAHHIILPSHT